jgi:copper chaperone
MNKITLKIEGMSCSHCVKAVTDGVGELAGVESVVVDLVGKTAIIEYQPEKVALEDFKQAIAEAGFDVQ